METRPSRICNGARTSPDVVSKDVAPPRTSARYVFPTLCCWNCLENSRAAERSRAMASAPVVGYIFCMNDPMYLHSSCWGMYLVQPVNGVKRTVLTEFLLDVYAVMRTRWFESVDTYCARCLRRGPLWARKCIQRVNGKKTCERKVYILLQKAQRRVGIRALEVC
jgi:hypothetical protein